MKADSRSGRAGVVVVGGGPGGYAAAFLAADLGLDVTLVDPAENPGGVCLYHGCIPSKTLLHVARVIHEAGQAAEWGVEFGEPRIDLDRLRSFKQRVVDKLTGGLGQLLRQRKIRHVRGRGKLLDAHTLAIEPGGDDEAPGSLEFEHVVLATGSRPAVLPGFPHDASRLLDSTGALELRDVPGSLLVVGGGYIGLELGSVYAALGSRVTVVEMTPGLLPGVDRDLVRPLAQRLERELAAIRLETRVAGVEPRSDGLAVRFEGQDDTEETFEAVLVAVGRRPNHENLGLENTRARVGDEGFVEVDGQGRTAEPSVWAIGDLVGQPMLAHKATHEGRIAAEAIAGHKVAFDAQAIPAVVFTDPEVAWCGLTEDQAKAAGRSIRVARFPWAASGRAATQGRGDGVTKLVIDPETERILGVGLAGPGAGELIAEGVVAVEMGALARDLALAVHPHPTLSETLMEAAEVFFGQSTHVYRPRK